MSKYDRITEVEKNIDEIVEVEKFNPFHDAAGKFSSSNGFKTYSANPNTRAGAMAIARSAAAGHGNTANVHRQSYGENITQNAQWIGRGAKTPAGGTIVNGASHLRGKERFSGLAGASATGADWQSQNTARGRTTSPSKQTQQQQPQKPAPTKQTQQQTQTQQQQQKPAQQAQQQPQQKPASDRQPVDGKDISATYKYDSKKTGTALNQVAEQQGYSGKPNVIKDKAEFSKAVADSGVMAYRTIDSGTDVVTGKYKTGAQFADDLKNADNFAHNGNGMRVYGSGIYIAATRNPVQGKAPSRLDTDAAKRDSKGYGSSNAKTVAMTLRKDAKIGDHDQLKSEFNNIPSRTRHQKYGYDSKDGFAAFCASKGYDAIIAKDAGWKCDYVIVYNRTKLVVFDG